jgi:hypothetical protein
VCSKTYRMEDVKATPISCPRERNNQRKPVRTGMSRCGTAAMIAMLVELTKKPNPIPRGSLSSKSDQILKNEASQTTPSHFCTHPDEGFKKLIARVAATGKIPARRREVR